MKTLRITIPKDTRSPLAYMNAVVGMFRARYGKTPVAIEMSKRTILRYADSLLPDIGYYPRNPGLFFRGRYKAIPIKKVK